MTRLWLHGASVGDMRALYPFVSAWDAQYPESQCTITAWTRGGRALGRSLFVQHHFTAPPVPFRATTVPFLKRYQPDLAVFEYLELYPGWISACHALGIPTLVIDGRVTERSLRIRWLLKNAARRLDGFCAQTDGDAQAAELLGVRAGCIQVCGNGKYDGLEHAAPEPKDSLKAVLGRPDVVIGSLHIDEEDDALRALSRTRLSAVIAPRYIERSKTIEAKCQRLGLTVSRRSRGQPTGQVCILDTYGELGAAYGVAKVSIVGGTFGRRNGQNLVEPAMHNNRIIHGPRTGNIQLECSALASSGALQVNSWSDAFAAVDIPFDNIQTRKALQRLTGATALNLEVARRLIEGRSVQNHGMIQQ